VITQNHCLDKLDDDDGCGGGDKFYRNLSTKNIEAREPLSMAEVEPYWKSLLGEKVQHNKIAEWIRREERRKISNMDWVPVRTMGTTSLLLKAQNCKSPGSYKIQN
jgi:hypothetical protein